MTCPVASPVIDTARLRLSPYTPADADALVSNANHARVARMMSTVPLPFTHADALDRIVRRRCGAERFTLAIRDRRTGEAIGEIGAGSMEEDAPPQIGYFLRPDCWGRGLAGEALGAALGHVFGVLEWPGVDAETLDENPSSARVLLRAGFEVVEATTCHSLARSGASPSTLHALTMEDWFAPALRTPRLTLRLRDPLDAERMAGLLNDYAVSAMLSVVPHPYTLADAEDWLSERLDDRRDVVFVLDAGEGAIGVIGLERIAPGTRRLGFWLGRPYWRRGLMTEAVRAALQWAFVEGGVARIQSEAYLDNPGSRRIHSLLGFEEGAPCMMHSRARGGEAPGVTLTLTREDWTPTP